MSWQALRDDGVIDVSDTAEIIHRQLGMFERRRPVSRSLTRLCPDKGPSGGRDIR
ncbi:hypothetical protein [Tsukamurella tyrosinosolvens]|uniref:hypothetical protein n=1 Tax=Tsukamurella tyrosinosolvens TaxID=57704 RepID=UPI003F4A4F40